MKIPISFLLQVKLHVFLNVKKPNEVNSFSNLYEKKVVIKLSKKKKIKILKPFFSILTPFIQVYIINLLQTFKFKVLKALFFSF